MKMGVRHASHEHDLSLYQEKFKDTSCDGCEEVIEGPAYNCDSCQSFTIHESCFELPKAVESPLHPHHPLVLLPRTSTGFICDVCRNLSKGVVYYCSKCDFNLDIGCAFPNKNGKSIRSSSDGQSENHITEIQHFLDDDHKLYLFYCRKQDRRRCNACNQQLSSDACYGCLECDLFLHKSCLEIPKAIQHHYHPHPLKPSLEVTFNLCCGCITDQTNLQYRCSLDGFNLHLLCAQNSTERTPPLCHKYHPNHDLFCFVPHVSIGASCRCDHCDEPCDTAFYRCFQCDLSVHLDCIPIPQKVDYPEHCHPLIRKDSFCEDDSGVYYCYACGERRNPNFPVYWCQECPEEAPYVAHIECIVSEEDDFRRSSCHTSDDPKAVDEGLQVEHVKEQAEEEEEKIKGSTSVWHEHLLILTGKQGMETTDCDICEKAIEGDMYICEICSDVHFHPYCALLPGKITNPIHIHSLYGERFSNPYYFMCGLCKNVTDSYCRYSCHECSFTLEVKCAFLNNDQYQDCKEKQSQSSRKRHFSHPHELILVKCTTDAFFCKLCKFPLSGFTYCCLDCQFFIHESCSEIQQQIQPSYHLPHRLIAIELGLGKYCGVCGSPLSNIVFSCYECDFFVHFLCGTYPTSSLKLKFHQHSLFPFSGSILSNLDFFPVDSFRCCECGDTFSDSYYRCVECDLNVHPECLPLPKIVKLEDHCDPLTLMSSMREDYSGVHYCDICLKPRDPNYPVYWCEECELNECWFAAHVECVIQEASPELMGW